MTGSFTEGRLTSLESMVKDKDKTSNDTYAEEMQSHFLGNEAIINIEDYAEAVKEILPTITAEEVSEQAKRWWFYMDLPRRH